MTVWFTSDHHFGHANIIGYSRRPFEGVEAMNEALIEGWNGTVADKDEVWVLGDFALGRIEATLPLVGSLRGYKRLLCGNHDRCWSGHGARSEAWVGRYLTAGFDEVHQGQVALEVGGRQVLACHFPYHGDSHDHDRYLDARPVDEGQWLLHGHVHERWRQRDRMINVGVDVWDYRPVSAVTLGELMDRGPGERAVPARLGKSPAPPG